MSLANNQRDMNNSPRQKTMKDLKNLKVIPKKTLIHSPKTIFCILITINFDDLSTEVEST